MPVSLGLTLWLSLPLAAQAHTPPAECVQPERPAAPISQRNWDRFMHAVDRFRACTSEAMTYHQTAASRHHDDARRAVDQWNLFVQHSLNAPQDFPHERSTPLPVPHIPEAR